MKKRRQRIKRFARANRKGAQQVFNQGGFQQWTGTQVWGYSDKEVRDLQSFFLSAAAPPGRGKRRSTSLLLLDDIAWRPALAPITTYAMVVWQAITEPNNAAAYLRSLVAWYRAQAKRSPPRNFRRCMRPFFRHDTFTSKVWLGTGGLRNFQGPGRHLSQHSRNWPQNVHQQAQRSLAEQIGQTGGQAKLG